MSPATTTRVGLGECESLALFVFCSLPLGRMNQGGTIVLSDRFSESVVRSRCRRRGRIVVKTKEWKERACWRYGNESAFQNDARVRECVQRRESRSWPRGVWTESARATAIKSYQKGASRLGDSSREEDETSDGAKRTVKERTKSRVKEGKQKTTMVPGVL